MEEGAGCSSQHPCRGLSLPVGSLPWGPQGPRWPHGHAERLGKPPPSPSCTHGIRSCVCTLESRATLPKDCAAFHKALEKHLVCRAELAEPCKILALCTDHLPSFVIHECQKIYFLCHWWRRWQALEPAPVRAQPHCKHPRLMPAQRGLPLLSGHWSNLTHYRSAPRAAIRASSQTPYKIQCITTAHLSLSIKLAMTKDESLFHKSTPTGIGLVIP